MTEPIDEPVGESKPPHTYESAVPAPLVSILADSSGVARSSRRFIIVAVVAIAVLILGVLLPALGASGPQGPSIPAGTMAFGRPGSGCAVEDAATTFPSSTGFVAAAQLTRRVPRVRMSPPP